MQANPVGAFSQDCRTSKNGIANLGVWSPTLIEQVQVEVNSDFEDTDEPRLVDRLTEAAVSFANSSWMFFKRSLKGPSFNLITPHAGGNSIGSIFSIDLLKIDGEKRLLLSLGRDEDPGTDTMCFWWIRCPRNIDATEFKNTVRKCVSELIHDGAYVLRERANLRRGFNKPINSRQIQT